MTYLNPPNPLFKGAHQAYVRTRAHGHRFAVLRPASDDALLILRSDWLRLDRTILFGKTEQPEIYTTGESIDSQPVS